MLGQMSEVVRGCSAFQGAQLLDGRRVNREDRVSDDGVEKIADGVKHTVKHLTLAFVNKEGMEVNGAAGFGELEAIPVVLEAEALLDDDAEPGLGALNEELVDDHRILQKYSMHRNLKDSFGERVSIKMVTGGSS